MSTSRPTTKQLLLPLCHVTISVLLLVDSVCCNVCNFVCETAVAAIISDQKRNRKLIPRDVITERREEEQCIGLRDYDMYFNQKFGTEFNHQTAITVEHAKFT